MNPRAKSWIDAASKLGAITPFDPNRPSVRWLHGSVEVRSTVGIGRSQLLVPPATLGTPRTEFPYLPTATAAKMANARTSTFDHGEESCATDRLACSEFTTSLPCLHGPQSVPTPEFRW